MWRCHTSNQIYHTSNQIYKAKKERWRCHTSNQIYKAKKERTQLPKEKEQNITDWVKHDSH